MYDDLHQKLSEWIGRWKYEETISIQFLNLCFFGRIVEPSLMEFRQAEIIVPLSISLGFIKSALLS